jgi:type IV pilus assembly protein PilC
MPRFLYKVRDPSGRSDAGALTAQSPDEAMRLLRVGNKVVVSLREEVQVDPAQTSANARRRVKRDDVIYFATQLAVMVDTGVPISEALTAISQQMAPGALKGIIQDICEHVKSGVEFSAALERYPGVFGKLFTAMMKASEASGTMGAMLQRAADYLAQEQETRKRIKGALIYPVAMLCFCLVVVTLLLVFVLPRFEGIYAGKGAILPLPTRVLLAVSNGLVKYWPLVLAGVVGLVFGLVAYLRSPGGRIMLDRIRINAPLLGGMYRKAYLSRSLRTMAAMVNAGVSMLDGLAITAEVAGNHFYAKIWTDVSERVREGSTLSEQLMKSQLIPRTVTQMVSAGERTGKLATVMNRAAAFCEDDLRVAVKTLTQMIEPIMIIIMGVIIGGIAMALLLPIFTISKVMAR